MTPQDTKTIRERTFQEPVTTINLCTSSDASEEADLLTHFCEQIKDLIPSLKITKDDDSTFQPPAIVVGHHDNVAYRAVPSGNMLASFLDALCHTAADAYPVPDAAKDLLKKIELPVQLKLYVSNNCPHCPNTIRRLLALAEASKKIRLVIINAEQFAEAAGKDKVRSVPTLILDEQFRWTGELDLQELMTISIRRDPAQLSATSLKQLLEEGEAERVANMMMDSGQIFPALIELLIHARWSVRLGAMVTMEYLADSAPNLADQIGNRLWKAFRQLPASVQTDVVHVFGEIGSESSRGYLHRIITGTYDGQVIDDAKEVLAEIAQD